MKTRAPGEKQSGLEVSALGEGGASASTPSLLSDVTPPSPAPSTCVFKL